MYPRLQKKTAAAVCSALLVAAGAAYAYWTAEGNGSGSVSAGSTVALVVNQVALPSAFYPGQVAQVLSGSFDNPNAGPVHVAANGVTASITGVSKALGAVAGLCSVDDFKLTDATSDNPAQEVAPGTGSGQWSGIEIQMVNSSGNQDACKGAAVSLAYTVTGA